MSSMYRDPPDLDLGTDHHIWWIRVDGVIVGAQYDHPRGPNKANADDGCPGTTVNTCAGTFWLDTPEARAKASGERNRWQVQSMDPFTISPSLLCSCGDHGFIRDGRWVTA